MRYGEEFAELLLAELSEQPRAWRRTVNVAHCGITARLAAAGLAGPPAGAAGARASLGAAVYFCCLEALQNTAKYAHATQIRICLRAQNGTLGFTVSDDGAGYDARRTPLGSGLRNMADRLAALGGRLEVQSAPGQGTAITGHLPVPAASDGR
jgi:signal transduction histidine kinase